jgi:hypothetical protein
VAPAPRRMCRCRFCTSARCPAGVPGFAFVRLDQHAAARPAAGRSPASAPRQRLRGWWRKCSQTVSTRPRASAPGRPPMRSRRPCRHSARCAQANGAASHRVIATPVARAGPRTARRAAAGRPRPASGHRPGPAGVADRVQRPAGASQRVRVAGAAGGGFAQPDLGARRRQVAKGSAWRGIQPRVCSGGGRPGCRRGRCPCQASSASVGAHEAGARDVAASARPPVSAMQPWSSRSTASGASDSISCR